MMMSSVARFKLIKTKVIFSYHTKVIPYHIKLGQRDFRSGQRLQIGARAITDRSRTTSQLLRKFEVFAIRLQWIINRQILSKNIREKIFLIMLNVLPKSWNETAYVWREWVCVFKLSVKLKADLNLPKQYGCLIK